MNIDYQDIIDLPHHVSKNHPSMSMQNRAAQFSPFAALTGYDEAIRETGRLTDEKKILDEDRKEEINGKLQFIEQNLNHKLLCHITYFKKDTKKNGGSYVKYVGSIKKIDLYQRCIITEDSTKILIDDIYDISYNESFDDL